MQHHWQKRSIKTLQWSNATSVKCYWSEAQKTNLKHRLCSQRKSFTSLADLNVRKLDLAQAAIKEHERLARWCWHCAFSSYFFASFLYLLDLPQREGCFLCSHGSRTFKNHTKFLCLLERRASGAEDNSTYWTLTQHPGRAEEVESKDNDPLEVF